MSEDGVCRENDGGDGASGLNTMIVLYLALAELSLEGYGVK
jgi:hypothetical protein